MSPQPLYNPSTASAAYQLRFAWSAFPAEPPLPNSISETINLLKPLWESDGLRVLEHHLSPDAVQILFSVLPSISPEFLAARAKGRLDHALRQSGTPVNFRRNFAVRSVGDNTRRDLEAYLARQVEKEEFADPRNAEAMEHFTVLNETVDLSQPATSTRGLYWYNLHLVLVVAGRHRLHDRELLQRLHDAALAVAQKKEHPVSRLAVLPDHLHLTLRPKIDESPEQVAFIYQNNLAHMLRQGRVWADSYYVGTFGEYTTHAVHRNAISSRDP